MKNSKNSTKMLRCFLMNARSTRLITCKMTQNELRFWSFFYTISERSVFPTKKTWKTCTSSRPISNLIKLPKMRFSRSTTCFKRNSKSSTRAPGGTLFLQSWWIFWQEKRMILLTPFCLAIEGCSKTKIPTRLFPWLTKRIKRKNRRFRFCHTVWTPKRLSTTILTSWNMLSSCLN